MNTLDKKYLVKGIIIFLCVCLSAFGIYLNQNIYLIVISAIVSVITAVFMAVDCWRYKSINVKKINT
jgi:hypothetical protein